MNSFNHVYDLCLFNINKKATTPPPQKKKKKKSTTIKLLKQFNFPDNRMHLFVLPRFINDELGLVKLMTVCQLGNKPLSEPTRTTRTPAFWGYPPSPHDYPYYWPVHTIDQFISDPKSKQGESRKIRKISEKLKFLTLVINLTHDTPSNGTDYLWQLWK